VSRRARARRWEAGAVLVVAYAVVAAVTHGLAPFAAGRPLYDGFAPPPPYRWVKPPPEFAAGNTPPQPAQRSLPLGSGGSEATNASTNDAQIIVGLPTGAVAAHPPDTSVTLTITPLDAATVAPLPPGQQAVSNAYSVTLAYQPSQAAVTTLTNTTGATIALTAALSGENLLYSADGHQWTKADSRPFGNTHGLTSTFLGPGYYVVTAPPTATTTTAGAGGGGRAGAVVGVVLLVGVVVVALAAGSWFRRRQAQAAKGRRSPARGRGRGSGGRATGRGRGTGRGPARGGTNRGRGRADPRRRRS
jgi:hypothetical protein